MKRIVNSIISVILAISMVLCTNLINVNAQERSTQLSKGQYLIINSKINKLGYFKDGVLVKEFSVATGKSSTPTPQVEEFLEAALIIHLEIDGWGFM